MTMTLNEWHPPLKVVHAVLSRSQTVQTAKVSTTSLSHKVSLAIDDFP